MKQALLLVDIQNDFLPGGALAVGEGDAVVPVANALMPLFDQGISALLWDLERHGMLDDVSIVAWGEFSEDASMVATRLRMRMNQLTAEVVQTSPLAVDLFSMNSRRARIYDFSGTGTMPEMDADPDHYEIDTGLLSLAGIADGDLVRVRGLVSPFGTAPADYVGRTVIDVQTDFRAALLRLGWHEGASQPFSVVDPEGLEIDLAEARKVLQNTIWSLVLLMWVDTFETTLTVRSSVRVTEPNFTAGLLL